MTLKFGTWLVGVGCCFALAGLMFLPAGLGQHKDTVVLAAGGALFSLGLVLVASGVYLKARHWAQLVPAATRFDRKGVPRLCNLCSKRDAVILCRVHELHLCADCLAQHYDFRACAYVPSTLQSISKSKAYSQTGSA